MPDADIASLTYELLKRMNGTLHALALDVGDLKLRMTEVEGRLGEHTRMFGHIEVAIAGLNGRMDRFDERMTRIERRLDLIEA